MGSPREPWGFYIVVALAGWVFIIFWFMFLWPFLAYSWNYWFS